MSSFIRLGDGIGRHTGLKILSPQGRAGSIPALGRTIGDSTEPNRLKISGDER